MSGRKRAKTCLRKRVRDTSFCNLGYRDSLAFSRNASLRACCPWPRLARSRKWVSASDSASSKVAISSISWFTLVCRRRDSTFLSSGMRMVSALIGDLLQELLGRHVTEFGETQFGMTQITQVAADDVAGVADDGKLDQVAVAFVTQVGLPSISDTRRKFIA